MIRLDEECSFDFVASSGALGWDGRGWPWEWPLRWTGLLDPSQFLVITKTVTLLPRRGNLRWWCPWRCVRKIPGGYVNAVGLTNPGLDEWFNWYYLSVCEAPWKTVLSIAPQDKAEAAAMAWKVRIMDVFGAVRGIEVNVSCPNTGDAPGVDKAVDIVRVVAEVSEKPVLVKLGWQDDFLGVCSDLDDGTVVAFDLINTVPWDQCQEYLGEYASPSPLAKYGLMGGVSGKPMASCSRQALKRAKYTGIKTPVISGGGVYTLDDVRERFDMGADAVAFGTLFLKAPWRPNRIVKRWRRECVLKSLP